MCVWEFEPTSSKRDKDQVGGGGGGSLPQTSIGQYWQTQNFHFDHLIVLSKEYAWKSLFKCSTYITGTPSFQHKLTSVLILYKKI